MKFYDRVNELEQLKKLERLSRQAFFFLRVTGRRRIGKTELIREWVNTIDYPVLYFYVTRQNETSLINEFQQILASSFPEYRAVEFRNISQFIQTVFDLHTRGKVLTIFDEFQEFQWSVPAAFSVIQKELDNKQKQMKGMLVTVGSLQSLMTKLFDDAKQPLFGRLNASLQCGSFTPGALEQLFDNKQISIKKRLDLYTLFHGIPYYYKLIDDYRLWGKSIFTILQKLMLGKNSILANEGKQLLVSEFGRNYTAWFSILKAVSSGNTRLSEIVNKSGVPMENINRYLNELINYYQMIERRQPFGARAGGKISRYYISDRFTDVWFRYIYRNQSLLELGMTDVVSEKIRLDFRSYKGRVFEEYCKEYLIEQNQAGKISFDEIGSWWDRGKTEIDIITVSHSTKSITFYECKLKGKRFNVNELKRKTVKFFNSVGNLQSYERYYRLISAENWKNLKCF